MSSIALKLLAEKSPPIYKQFTKPKNLYELLNLLENNGIGEKVRPGRWIKKGLNDCYYIVKKVTLKVDLKHGKAKGIKIWKGQGIKDKKEVIRKALKENWEVYVPKSKST